jgi:hypothetical protein
LTKHDATVCGSCDCRRRKVRDYLLSPEHPVGRFKARVFAAAGYRREAWQQLREELRALAGVLDVTPAAADEYGQRYVGTGILTGPSGRALPIVSVWLIPSVGEPPRLITVYPGGAT